MKKLLLPIFLVLGISMFLGVVYAESDTMVQQQINSINNYCKSLSSVCSPWSVCDNNIKTRSCKLIDSNNANKEINPDVCSNSQYKPVEVLPCDIMISNLTCKDSDIMEEFNTKQIYGDELYYKGHIVNEKQNADYWDTCTDLQTADSNLGWTPTTEGKILMEYYCNGDNYQYHAIECPVGCKEGACVNPCVDNGKDYYTKGVAYIDYTGYHNIPDEAKDTTDFCENDNQLRKYYCKEGSVGIASDDYYCPFGCKDGACSKINPDNTQQPVDINQQIETIPNETIRQKLKQNIDYSAVCQGCVIDSKCYPFGFRKGGNYCDDKTSKFVNQNIPNSNCDNNFECDSNLCINSKCVNGNLWQKFLNWLNRLFGGK